MGDETTPTFTKIHLSFAALKSAYVDWSKLADDSRSKPIDTYLKGVNAPLVKKDQELADSLNVPLKDLDKKLRTHKNTSCAMQVSMAFNSTRHTIPGGSFRRASTELDGSPGFYMMAVDEITAWLTDTFGPGVDLKKVNPSNPKAPIKGLNGVLTFGIDHTEFWENNSVLQAKGGMGGMDDGFIWSRQPILFWQIGDGTPAGDDEDADALPGWLRGWWKVWDGGTYYYYFHDMPNVSMTKTPPTGSGPPTQHAVSNRGNVQMKGDQMIVTWNVYRDKGGIPIKRATVETFNVRGANADSKLLNATSNNYSPLVATRI